MSSRKHARAQGGGATGKGSWAGRVAAGVSGLLASLALIVPGAASAGTIDGISVTVTPLSSTVTYSLPATKSAPALTTYLGYVVNIQNVSGNTINNIYFTGTVTPTDSTETSTLNFFPSADGPNCSVGAANNTVVCTVGQLKAGAAAPSFAVFFTSPVRDTVAPLPTGDLTNCTGTDCASLSWVTYYAETTGGTGTPSPSNSTVSSTPPGIQTALGTSNPTQIKSSVPRSGGSLFTGNGGVPQPTSTTNPLAYPFATSVAIPGGATYTTAQLDVAGSPTTDCVDFTTCFKSTLTIPGTFSPYLSITLRQDASTIASGTKIGSVLIYYTPTGGTEQLVGDCPSPTTPLAGGVPCIAKRVYYKNKTVPGWTPDLDGDFEWQIINTSNGSYRLI